MSKRPKPQPRTPARLARRGCLGMFPQNSDGFPFGGKTWKLVTWMCGSKPPPIGKLQSGRAG